MLRNNIVEFKLQHLPELDSLRSLAVLFVLLAHFLPSIGFMLPYSWYGVDLFFTLSGFLITTILINALKNDGYKKRILIIKNFIIRRTLRLFPAYYLLLIIFWILKNYFGLWIWRDEFTPYFFSYTPNWLFLKIGLNNAACFSHLWSLGVEEQFYLFWPWLVLFINAKFRVTLIILMIIISLVISYVYHDNNVHLLPFANFHTLGIGALVACLYTSRSSIIIWLEKYRMPIVFIACIHLVFVLSIFKEGASFNYLYRAFSLCICTVSLLIAGIFGWTGVWGIISRNKKIQYFGKISYGIYLYHMAIPVLLAVILNKLHYRVNNIVLFFAYFLLTILTAAFSYKYIETPFLKLKKRFNN